MGKESLADLVKRIANKEVTEPKVVYMALFSIAEEWEEFLQLLQVGLSINYNTLPIWQTQVREKLIEMGIKEKEVTSGTKENRH